MGTTLDALLRLQNVERDLAQVRRRLKTRKGAVIAQQGRIATLTEDAASLKEKLLHQRKTADQYELDLQSKEEHVAHLRGSLNTAKTNKEYAAVLTEINTFKADNAKLEEDGLKVMAEIDQTRAEAEALDAKIAEEQSRLDQIEKDSADEVARLSTMLEQLQAKRDEAAQAVPRETLSTFERIAANFDGEAMAVIEIEGRKPPHTYVCGGCFMGLNAEHANVLQTRDEIRTCNNCGRILYLQRETEGSPAS
jgi:uncharacterized protein